MAQNDPPPIALRAITIASQVHLEIEVAQKTLIYCAVKKVIISPIKIGHSH